MRVQRPGQCAVPPLFAWTGAYRMRERVVLQEGHDVRQGQKSQSSRGRNVESWANHRV